MLAMKGSAYTEAQIAFALKKVEMGTRVDEVCRKMCTSEGNPIIERKTMSAYAVGRQIGLLKQIVADLTLNKEMLQEVLKTSLKVRHPRLIVTALVKGYRVSVRWACNVVVLHCSAWYYKQHWRDDRPL